MLAQEAGLRGGAVVLGTQQVFPSQARPNLHVQGVAAHAPAGSDAAPLACKTAGSQAGGPRLARGLRWHPRPPSRAGTGESSSSRKRQPSCCHPAARRPGSTCREGAGNQVCFCSSSLLGAVGFPAWWMRRPNPGGSASHHLRSRTVLPPQACTRTTRTCPFPASQTPSLATTTQAPADAQGA